MAKRPGKQIVPAKQPGHDGKQNAGKALAKTKRKMEMGRGRPNQSGPTPRIRTMAARERRVMTVLMTVSDQIRTNEEMAKAAGVSLTTFKRIKSDPWFRAEWQKLIDAELQALTPTVLHRAFKNSAELGREGHYDRRMLLTMAGLQTTANKGDGAGGHVTINLNVSDRLSQALAKKEAVLQRIENKRQDDGAGPVIEADWEDIGQE